VSAYELVLGADDLGLADVATLVSTCRALRASPLGCIITGISIYAEEGQMPIEYLFNTLFMVQTNIKTYCSSVNYMCLKIIERVKSQGIPIAPMFTPGGEMRFYELLISRLSCCDDYAKTWFFMHMIECHLEDDKPWYTLKYSEEEFNYVMDFFEEALPKTYKTFIENNIIILQPDDTTNGAYLTILNILAGWWRVRFEPESSDGSSD
jgi:hypothetical protein